MRSCLAALLLITACSSSDSKTEPTNDPATPATKTASEDGGKTARARPDAAVESAELPEVPGVAPLTAALVANKRVPASKKLNVLGLRAQRAGNYAEAIEHYKKAIEGDAGYLLARYNLACTLVQAGEPAQGLTLLDQFRELDCEACRERLARARVDPDWRLIWKDTIFQRITAPPEEGNFAGIAYFAARLPATSKRAGFTIRPRLVLDRAPGAATIPTFELVLRTAKREIARKTFDIEKRKGNTMLSQIRIPGVGRYALDVVAGDRVHQSQTFEVKQTLCYGGERSFEIGREGLKLWSGRTNDYDGEDELLFVGEDADDQAELRWPFPLPGDDRYTYLQVWKHNGKVTETTDLDIESTDLDAYEPQPGEPYDEDCPIGRAPLTFEASAAPGRWLLGLYSKRGLSFEISYTLRKGTFVNNATLTERVLAKPPSWTNKLFEEHNIVDEPNPPVWDGTKSPNSTRLVRAATRSAETYKKLMAYVAGVRRKNPSADAAKELLALAAVHGGPWKKSELPSKAAWPLAAVPYTHRDVPEGTCTASRCSQYPAMSADGKTFVTYEDEEIAFWDEQDECGRPEGEFMTFWSVADNSSTDSVDLSNFKPMSCGGSSGPLEAGFKAMLIDTDELLIVDKNGKTVKKLEFYANFDYCLLAGVRVVVGVIHEGITHCHETGTPTFEAVAY